MAKAFQAKSFQGFLAKGLNFKLLMFLVFLIGLGILLAAGCERMGRAPFLRNKPAEAQPGARLNREARGPTAGAPDKSGSAAGKGASPGEPIDRNAQVIVLGYHRFVEKVRHPETEITSADFEAQLNALKEQQVAVISMADFLAWKRGEKNIPARCALITIDDGYKSGYSVAWPILKKFGYPFTVFIYTDYVKGGPKSGGESLSWTDLAEMRDAGVNIQSHTVSHHDLRKKGNRQPAAYEEFLWQELSGSKEILPNLNISQFGMVEPRRSC